MNFMKDRNYKIREGADLLYYNKQIDETQRVFGVPGASLYHANLDNEKNLQLGIQGEKRVAAQLEKLAAQYPNTYVFHSMKLPGKIGDMDHIVVQGGKALLVDTKNWKTEATYEMKPSNTGSEDIILRDGKEFDGGEIHLYQQKKDWSDYLSLLNIKVSAVLVVANYKSVIKTEDKHHNHFDFMNIKGLYGLFEKTFKKGDVPRLLSDVLKLYCNMVQDPDFDTNDRNNFEYVDNSYKTYTTNNNHSYTYSGYTPKATRMSKWLTFWSIMNYVLLPFIWVFVGASVIPLIILAHKHRKTIRRLDYGGKGRVTTTLIFSYILLAGWCYFIAYIIFSMF